MNKPLNVLVITYWSYSDPLIQAYTLPYIRIIQRQLPPHSRLVLLTLERQKSKTHRLEIRNELAAENIEWITMQYSSFGLGIVAKWINMLAYLVYFILRNNISVLHCWAMPGGAVGYLLSQLTGRVLIIDSFEPHAETMLENGTWGRWSVAYRLLFWLERKQTHKARFLIGATQRMAEYAKEKYDKEIKEFYVKPACVDLMLFSEKNLKDELLLKELNLNDKIICVYAGKFGGMYLEQEIFDFFKVAYQYWGDTFRVLLLSNVTQGKVAAYCTKCGLPTEVLKLVFVPHAIVPQYIGLGDFAFNPVKPVPSRRYGTPIKDGEYWALGLPVVITKGISDDSRIIEENEIGAVLQDLSETEYQVAVIKIDKLLQKPRKENYESIRAIAEKYRNFEIAERLYKKIYGKILDPFYDERTFVTPQAE